MVTQTLAQRQAAADHVASLCRAVARNLPKAAYRFQGETLLIWENSRKLAVPHRVTATGCTCDVATLQGACWHQVARRMLLEVPAPEPTPAAPAAVRVCSLDSIADELAA